MHYNNPGRLPQQYDTGTGLRVHFQPAKGPGARPHDVGILTLAQFILDIPPGQERVVANQTFCSRDCSRRLSQPVTLIGQSLHMHGLGRAITTRRVRVDEQRNEAVELPPLVTLPAFDYNFQTWCVGGWCSRGTRGSCSRVLQYSTHSAHSSVVVHSSPACLPTLLPLAPTLPPPPPHPAGLTFQMLMQRCTLVRS